MRTAVIRTFADSRGFYRILGVNQNACRDEIRTAYLKLAKVYHPDTPTGDTEKFKKIAEAWSVLGNEKTRALYDLETKNQQQDIKKPSTQQNEYERFNIFRHDPVKSALFRRFVANPFVRKIIEKYPVHWKVLIVFGFVLGIFFSHFDERFNHDERDKMGFFRSMEDYLRQKRERKYFEDDDD